MQVRNGKDFWAGLMFAGIGLGFMLASFNYPMGSAFRMGPAYFPAVVGGLLALLGAVIFFRAFVSKLEHPLTVLRFRLPLLIAALALGGARYLAENWFKDAPMAELALNALALFLFIGAFGPRALFLILIAVAIFGYAVKPLGLVLAIALLVVMCAAAGDDFRKKEVFALTIGLVLFGGLVFVKGLGLLFHLWPGR